MKKIVSCGCSFAHGFYFKDSAWATKIRSGLAEVNESKENATGINKTYSELLAKKIECESVNLSMPGVSNYAIGKQVEYAITLRPDFIIFNTTTFNRLDLKKINSQDIVGSQPTINDFKRGRYPSEHIDTGNASIYSSTYISFINGIWPVDDKQALTEFITSYDTYVSTKIKQDQDRFIIMGTLNLLEHSKIPYACIDITSSFPAGYSDRIISLSDVELIKRFPISTDSLHFNQQGHQFISDQIHQRLTTNFY